MPPRILVVLELHRMVGSVRALVRARRLVERDGGTLSLLVVCPAVHGYAGRDAFRLLDALLARSRASADATIFVRTGATYDEITRAVARERPSLLVVGDEAASGATWANLAATLRIPIFVARRARPRASVVAATDGSELELPALCDALAIAPPEATLALFHCFDSFAAWTEATRRGDADHTSTLIHRLRERRLEVLHRAAAPRRARVVFASGTEVATALREHCSREDPDFVVIGAGRQALIAAQRARTAARLIERLDQSVLVVPLAAAPA